MLQISLVLSISLSLPSLLYFSPFFLQFLYLKMLTGPPQWARNHQIEFFDFKDGDSWVVDHALRTVIYSGQVNIYYETGKHITSVTLMRTTMQFDLPFDRMWRAPPEGPNGSAASSYAPPRGPRWKVTPCKRVVVRLPPPLDPRKWRMSSIGYGYGMFSYSGSIGDSPREEEGPSQEEDPSEVKGVDEGTTKPKS